MSAITIMDGRTLPEDPNPKWMGYSVGHREARNALTRLHKGRGGDRPAVIGLVRHSETALAHAPGVKLMKLMEPIS
jgi:hypothetical protein